MIKVILTLILIGLIRGHLVVVKNLIELVGKIGSVEHVFDLFLLIFEKQAVVKSEVD